MRAFTTSFVLLLCISNVTPRPKSNPTWYIVNGENATRNEFPWMAMITNQIGMLLCGASLITTRHVLTAAHCTQGMPENDPFMISVRLGVYSLYDIFTDGPQVMEVKRIIRYPSFVPVYTRDYAILELKHDVNIAPNVKPICISSELPPTGSSVTTTGWGLMGQDKYLGEILQKVTIPVWDLERCKELFGNDISNYTICAGDTELQKDTCHMDSGGPLLWRNQGNWSLVGITSFGDDECGSTTFPGVYANVPFVRGWINSTIGPNSFC